jgi:hypothetical protein
LTAKISTFDWYGNPERLTIKPVPDSVLSVATPTSGYDAFGLSDGTDDSDASAVPPISGASDTMLAGDFGKHLEEDLPIISPFEINQNVIYDPPHVSPRIRAQDGVLLACHRPLEPLEERDYQEIIITHQAHDDIRRRLDQYGVFDKQLFPDLDGIAKWLKYRVFEINGKI